MAPSPPSSVKHSGALLFVQSQTCGRSPPHSAAGFTSASITQLTRDLGSHNCSVCLSVRVRRQETAGNAKAGRNAVLRVGEWSLHDLSPESLWSSLAAVRQSPSLGSHEHWDETGVGRSHNGFCGSHGDGRAARGAGLALRRGPPHSQRRRRRPIGGRERRPPTVV